MKQIKRLLIVILTFVMLVGTAAPKTTASAALTSQTGAPKTAVSAALTSQTGVPGKVELVSISPKAYNRITITWKKVPGATSYRIYYRAKKAKKWTRVAIVKPSQLHYTHVSSKSFPITIGKDYAYTVRAYNSKSRKLGGYNKAGLSTHTLPNKVSLTSAIWNDDHTSVTVTWKKAGGATYYRIYRRVDSASKWRCVGTVRSGKLQFIDTSPVKDKKNSYTVRACNKPAKAAGKFSGTQVTAVSREVAEKNQTAKLLKNSKTGKKTSQIILVVDHNLSFWEKNKNGSWTQKLSAYCGYGSNGLNDDRSEGDRTTPIGSFPILHGFGTADSPKSTLKYRKITPNSYWSGEYSTYNQWVESARPIGGEHLISYYQYKYAMAIGFNRNPVVYKKGSAIFLHCKSYDHWSTAGCVSVQESVMVRLLELSRNGVYIVIVREKSDISNY